MMRRSRIPRRVKQEPSIKHEELSLATAPPRRQKRGLSSVQEDSTAGSKKRVKKEGTDSLPLSSSSLSTDVKTETTTVKDEKSAELQSRKLKAYNQYAKQSPFPDFAHPTPEECRLAHSILQKLHGARVRPERVVARSDRAGCGDSPCVLDALVRTILSQNTSDTNSTRAKKSMDQVYGGDNEGNANDDYWNRIVAGGQSKLQETIKCGGLSAVKSKVILSILTQTKEKHGRYSLDHLLNSSNTALSNEDAMAELISFRGVGPKTASCVLLFCLQRDSFAVDTHVHRITGLLGWRPKSATRDETHQHLDVRIPDEDKYGLHVLLVTHGRECDECRAGGRNLGKCELRKAFRKGKMEEESGEDAKLEEEVVKQEEGSKGRGVVVKREKLVKQEMEVKEEVVKVEEMAKEEEVVNEDVANEENMVKEEVVKEEKVAKEASVKREKVAKKEAVKVEEMTKEEEGIAKNERVKEEEVAVKKERVKEGVVKKEVVKKEED